MLQPIAPEVATIETTLDGLDVGVFDVPATPGLTAEVQLVFRVSIEGRPAYSKYRVSRQMMQDVPTWKQVVGPSIAESLRQLK